MSRTIITRQDVAAATMAAQYNLPMNQNLAVAEEVINQPDDWKTTLLKLLPAEVIGAYITIDGILKGSALAPTSAVYNTIIWVVFFALFVLNYLYLRPTVAKSKQLWLSVFAFPVWVFSLGGPFLYIGLSADIVHLIGSILLVLYTALSVLVMRD